MLDRTYVIDQSTTPDVNVFTVKSVLKELDNIVSNGILGCESLCPRQEFSGVNGSLLDWETSCQRRFFYCVVYVSREETEKRLT